MSVVSKALYETAALPIADTALYAAPASTRTIIDKMTVTNTTGAALTLTAYLVPATGSIGAANKVISAQSIAAGASYLCPEVVGHTLNTGDSIHTETSALGLTGRISGREVV